MCKKYLNWHKSGFFLLKMIDVKKNIYINDIVLTQDNSQPQMVNTIAKNLGLSSIISVRTVHSVHSFICILESKKGWKIVYSADGSPCFQLVKAIYGATLFIHG